MELETILNIAFLVISLSLIVIVLLQQQSSGAGSVFGGGGGGGESYRSKRGAEKTLFNLTFVLLTLFIFVGLALAVVNVGG